MAILDTSAIIELIRGNTAVASFIESLGLPLKISAITYYELSVGIRSKKESDQLTSYLLQFPVVAINAEHAQLAGQVQRNLISRGMEIEPLDCFVAANALILCEPVVTANISHFTRIDGLQVISCFPS